jgi:hypothetical protein
MRPFLTWCAYMPKTICLARSICSSFGSITDGDAGVRERDRDAGAHRARADDAGLLDRRAASAAAARNLAEFAFREEQWRSAATALERTSSSKSRYSRARPRSNRSRGRFDRVDQLVRGKPPLSSGGTILCACATTNGVANRSSPTMPSSVGAETRRFGASRARFDQRDAHRRRRPRRARRGGPAPSRAASHRGSSP